MVFDNMNNGMAPLSVYYPQKDTIGIEDRCRRILLFYPRASNARKIGSWIYEDVGEPDSIFEGIGHVPEKNEFRSHQFHPGFFMIFPYFFPLINC